MALDHTTGEVFVGERDIVDRGHYANNPERADAAQNPEISQEERDAVISAYAAQQTMQSVQGKTADPNHIQVGIEQRL